MPKQKSFDPKDMRPLPYTDIITDKIIEFAEPITANAILNDYEYKSTFRPKQDHSNNEHQQLDIYKKFVNEFADENEKTNYDTIVG